MKKINFQGLESLPERAGFPQRLSQTEMEHELDHCPAPWKCPKQCYEACVGCSQKQDRGD